MRTERKGFTLIELLIVVVIIGILAAIAIPKFANTKEKAYMATMKSDLRNLITAEEAYFSDNTTYTTALATTQYDPSQGVTYSVTNASGTGWEATATHVGLVGATPSGCHIAVGSLFDDGERGRGRAVLPVRDTNWKVDMCYRRVAEVRSDSPHLPAAALTRCSGQVRFRAPHARSSPASLRFKKSRSVTLSVLAIAHSYASAASNPRPRRRSRSARMA